LFTKIKFFVISQNKQTTVPLITCAFKQPGILTHVSVIIEPPMHTHARLPAEGTNDVLQV